MKNIMINVLTVLMILFSSCNLKGLLDIDVNEDLEDINLRIHLKKSEDFEEKLSDNNEILKNLLTSKFKLSDDQIKAILYFQKVVVDFAEGDQYTDSGFYKFINGLEDQVIKSLAESILCVVTEIAEIKEFIKIVKNYKKRQELHLECVKLEDDYITMLRDAYNKPIVYRCQFIEIHNQAQKDKFEVFKNRRIKALDFVSGQDTRQVIRHIKEIVDGGQFSKELSQIDKNRYFTRFIFTIMKVRSFREGLIPNLVTNILELLKIIDEVKVFIDAEKDLDKKQKMENQFNVVKKEYESVIRHAYMDPSSVTYYTSDESLLRFFDLKDLKVHKESFKLIISS
ncbi:BTA121 domain-containing protein surface lipoprotein [Borrelia duttonii]|uniref:BTA121 domain-containing protein surface lipoprotein n=1 Tax=Borrelia duttonii TaxID=40834 RepID=UPI0002F3090A